MEEFINRNLDVAIFEVSKDKGNGSEKGKDFKHFFSGVGKDQRAKVGILIFINKNMKTIANLGKSTSNDLLKERF